MSVRVRERERKREVSDSKHLEILVVPSHVVTERKRECVRVCVCVRENAMAEG